MAENKQQEQLHKALFSSLVAMFSSTAMQQLGKLVNPLTNETEINLEGAQVTIDMLAMLQTKTAGNLDADEDKMLKDIVAMLQINYVDVSKAAPAKQEKTAPGAAAGEDEDDSPQESTGESPPADDPGPAAKSPKYHKSYGDESSEKSQ